MLVTLETPASYWMVNVYSRNGDNIYSLNDRQVSEVPFSIIVEQKKASLFSIEAPEEPPDDAAFRVATGDRRGLFVVRVFVQIRLTGSGSPARWKVDVQARQCEPTGERLAVVELESGGAQVFGDPLHRLGPIAQIEFAALDARTRKNYNPCGSTVAEHSARCLP